MNINTYDIDGCIFISPQVGGINPGPNDVIITGRSFEEASETYAMLAKRGITNHVFFNPLPFKLKTRQSAGEHKARVIKTLQAGGAKIGVHFEDDEVQAAVIKKECPNVPVVMIVHDLTNKENVRHLDY